MLGKPSALLLVCILNRFHPTRAILDKKLNIRFAFLDSFQSVNSANHHCSYCVVEAWPAVQSWSAVSAKVARHSIASRDFFGIGFERPLENLETIKGQKDVIGVCRAGEFAAVNTMASHLENNLLSIGNADSGNQKPRHTLTIMSPSKETRFVPQRQVHSSMIKRIRSSEIKFVP